MLLFARRCFYSTQEYHRKIHFCTSRIRASCLFLSDHTPARRRGVLTSAVTYLLQRQVRNHAFKDISLCSACNISGAIPARRERIFLASEKSVTSYRNQGGDVLWKTSVLEAMQ